MGDTYLERFEVAQPARLRRRYHYATDEFHKSAGVCPRFTEPGQASLMRLGRTCP
jgi:hypothetical protein